MLLQYSTTYHSKKKKESALMGKLLNSFGQWDILKFKLYLANLEFWAFL